MWQKQCFMLEVKGIWSEVVAERRRRRRAFYLAFTCDVKWKSVYFEQGNRGISEIKVQFNSFVVNGLYDLIYQYP